MNELVKDTIKASLGRREDKRTVFQCISRTEEENGKKIVKQAFNHKDRLNFSSRFRLHKLEIKVESVGNLM